MSGSPSAATQAANGANVGSSGQWSSANAISSSSSARSVAASATRTSRSPIAPASNAGSISASAPLARGRLRTAPQVDAHVVQAHGPVEVHDHRADRQHPRRVAAWEHARMDLADRIVAAGLEGERVRAEVVEGGEVVEVDGLLVALSNLPAPELNGTRVIRDPDDASGGPGRRPGGVPFPRSSVLRDRGGGRPASRDGGCGPGGGTPARGEVADDGGLDRRSSPRTASLSGVEIQVTSARMHELEAVRTVEVAAFGTPAEIAERFVGRRMLKDPRVRMFTAWIDGEPVGEASAYLLHDTVGIFGVGVVESARRRGIGAALTLRAARAFDDRTDLAWLQPVGDGSPDVRGPGVPARVGLGGLGDGDAER